MNDADSQRTWGWKSVILWILLPLAVGILLSLLIPRPAIGVLTLDDAIYSSTAQEMITQIDAARTHPEIKAVVLVLNSPGGTVTDTESVYLELARLRQTQPVVTVVEGMAASGAYYLAAGSDVVLAKPSSEVGNIGVIGYLPSSPAVMEEVYSTGPYKLWGSPRETFVREMEMLKQGFLQAVLLGRGDRLKVPAETVLRGQIWPGAEALRMGLIDGLGTQSQALDEAARMARIAHYRVVNLRQLSGLPETPVTPAQGAFFQEANGMRTAYPTESGLFYLYIPPAEQKP